MIVAAEPEADRHADDDSCPMSCDVHKFAIRCNKLNEEKAAECLDRYKQTDDGIDILLRVNAEES